MRCADDHSDPLRNESNPCFLSSCCAFARVRTRSLRGQTRELALAPLWSWDKTRVRLAGQSLCAWAPTGGRVGTSLTVVELDDKGRLLLPASLRRKLGARRFEVGLVAGRVELAPIQDVKALKGKYRNRIKGPWVKLEEMAEKLVREGKR